MKKFQFRLASLFTLREQERDLCRQLLGEALRQLEEIEMRRRDLEGQREFQIQELRQIGRPGELRVDGAAARRVYAGQLVTWLIQVEQQRILAENQVELCRQALVRADQQVKALENLRDKQLAEFQFDAERREARELEEAWMGAHAGEFRR